MDEPSNAMEDIALAAAIAAALHESRVHAAVTVAVTNGVVTLEGIVDKPEQRAAAERVARTFDGCADIVNAITIGAYRKRPGFPADRRALE